MSEPPIKAYLKQRAVGWPTLLATNLHQHIVHACGAWPPPYLTHGLDLMSSVNPHLTQATSLRGHTLTETLVAPFDTFKSSFYHSTTLGFPI